MPTTLTRDTAAPETVHQRSAYELWREAQSPYEGRHRGQSAVEDDPQNVHATSGEALS